MKNILLISVVVFFLPNAYANGEIPFHIKSVKAIEGSGFISLEGPGKIDSYGPGSTVRDYKEGAFLSVDIIKSLNSFENECHIWFENLGFKKEKTKLDYIIALNQNCINVIKEIKKSK